MAAAPGLRGAPAVAFADLPADVVCLIAGYVPLRPRLLVIARVCRRWRAAADLSVTSILPPMYYLGAIDRFPNLTACHFQGADGVPASWTAEQRGRIRSVRFHFSTENVLRRANFTSLTSLEATLVEDARRALPQIVEANAASLIALKLKAIRKNIWEEGDPVPPLPLSLPELRSLSISASRVGTVDSVLYFAPLHSQLTDLAIKFDIPSHYATSLPRLRRLTVQLVMGGAKLAGWLRAMPALTALNIGTLSPERGDIAGFLSDAAPTVEAISLSQKNVWSDKLLHCKRLRHVYLLKDSFSLLPALAPIASQISSMEVVTGSERPEQTRFFTQHFTALTKLTLRPDSLRRELPHWRLPHLRELTAHDQSLDYVTEALVAFPSLVHLCVLGAAECGDLQAFQAELRSAERRGLQSLRLLHTTLDLSALPRTFKWLTLTVSATAFVNFD